TSSARNLCPWHRVRREVRSDKPSMMACKACLNRHCGAHCIANYLDDRSGSADAGCVIDGVRLRLRLHAFGHVSLRFRDDHPVVFSDQKPAWNILPEGASNWNGDAVQ